jgi:hypothetical protein
MPLVGLSLVVKVGLAIAEARVITSNTVVGVVAELLIVLSGFIAGLLSSVAYRDSELGGVAIGLAAGLSWICLLHGWSTCAFALVAGPTSAGWYVGTRLIARYFAKGNADGVIGS